MSDDPTPRPGTAAYAAMTWAPTFHELCAVAAMHALLARGDADQRDVPSLAWAMADRMVEGGA